MAKAHNGALSGNLVLELDANEAQTLADILSMIGGVPGESRRGFAALISKAMSSAGWDYNEDKDDTHGNIWFGDLAEGNPLLDDLVKARKL